MKNSICRFGVVFAISVLIAALSASVSSAAWKYYQSPIYRFYYSDIRTKAIASGLAWRYPSYSYKAWTTANNVIGSYFTSSWFKRGNRIDVYISASSSYKSSGYNARWIVNGNKNRISKQYLSIQGSTISTAGSLGKYGQALTWGTTQMLFNNKTQLYRNASWWTLGSETRSMSSLFSYALSYYASECVYAYGPRRGKSAIYANSPKPADSFREGYTDQYSRLISWGALGRIASLGRANESQRWMLTSIGHFLAYGNVRQYRAVNTYTRTTYSFLNRLYSYRYHKYFYINAFNSAYTPSTYNPYGSTIRTITRNDFWTSKVGANIQCWRNITLYGYWYHFYVKQWVMDPSQIGLDGGPLL